MITDEQINKALKGMDFGPNMETVEQRKKFVAQAALKRICDYSAGNTITCILQELGVTKTLGGKPIKAARRWMYDQYKI